MDNSYEISREELEQVIVARAVRDPRYRRELCADPRRVIEKQLGGTRLPRDLEVEVVQETADQKFVVLPHGVVNEGDELSDDDLEEVAGGKSSRNRILCVIPSTYKNPFMSKNEFSVS